MNTALHDHCCQQMMQLYLNHHDFLSDEAIFCLNSSVNKNFPYWAPADPQASTASPKVVVWCAIAAQGIINPYFFKADNGASVTINSKHYNCMLTTFFLPELTHHNWNMETLWFQQRHST